MSFVFATFTKSPMMFPPGFHTFFWPRHLHHTQSRTLRRLSPSRPVPQQRQAAAEIETARRSGSKAISPFRYLKIKVYAARRRGSTRAVGYLSAGLTTRSGRIYFGDRLVGGRAGRRLPIVTTW